MSRRRWYILGSVAVVASLGFGYYAVSPLFRSIELNEPAPPSSPGSTQTVPAATAPVVGTPLHPASGTARIVAAGEISYLRYENFKTINGPDLYVYLAKDVDAKEFVNLGRLKATEGNVNYEIPAGINLTEYRYALVWCKAFSTLFNYADFLEQ